MTKQFVSEAITAVFSENPSVHQGPPIPQDDNTPQLPRAFQWREETLEITSLRKAWRSTKTDRGDVYLKRHWFECETADGRIATVYYDRGAKREPRWWLHSIEN